MPRRLVVSILLLMTATPVLAQWFDWKTPDIPRLANGRVDATAPVPHATDGHPDLTGQWVPTDASGSLFELENFQEWALKIMDEQERTFYVNDPRFNCLPDGPPSYIAGPSVGGNRRIVQTPTFIAVLNPDMTYRQIFMDGRELLEVPLIPTWLGYSVGHWEGDTLVVESNGFNDKTWLTREGLPHTDQLRITERYQRTSFGTMTLNIRYEDPGTLKQPVEANVTLGFRADTDLLEIVCNESETGQKHYSGELTQAENKIVEVPLETLKKYVGTYEGIWLGNMIKAEVTIENGELFLKRTPRYSDTGGNTDYDTSRLIPQSQNAFDSSFGLGWVFETDAKGEVNSVSEVHVSGAWPFKRVR
ncbi:MAG: hypothetical protein H6978_01725 [Gammaproteobacteria bacterium]|nr:hypothetical protein [Gammaproteobacteria bacterium]